MATAIFSIFVLGLVAMASSLDYEGNLDFVCRPLNPECRTGLRNLKTELFDHMLVLGPLESDNCDRSIGILTNKVEVTCTIPTTAEVTGEFWCGIVQYKFGFNSSPGTHLAMTGQVTGILKEDGQVVREWLANENSNLTGFISNSVEEERFRGLQYHLWTDVWRATGSCEQGLQERGTSGTARFEPLSILMLIVANFAFALVI